MCAVVTKDLGVDHLILMSQREKNMQPDRGSNPGHLAYRANALPTELPGRLHIFSPVIIKSVP